MNIQGLSIAALFFIPLFNLAKNPLQCMTFDECFEPLKQINNILKSLRCDKYFKNIEN